jgi:hypothetical protein
VLNDDEVGLLDKAFAAPDIGASLDKASHIDPDLFAESRNAPVSSEFYADTKPEIDRQKKVADMNIPDIKANYPSTTKFLEKDDNAAMASDDLDVLKGMEGAVRDKKKGFFGLRADDIERGFAALRRTGNYMQADDSMNDVSQMAVIEEDKPENRIDLVRALAKRGMATGSTFNVDRYIESTPEEREIMRSEAYNKLADISGSIAARTAEIESIPHSQAVEKFFQSKGWGAGLSAVAEDPLEVITSIATESFVQFAPALPLALVSGGLGGLGAGMTSFSMEYAGDIIGSMQEAGIDVKDKDAMLAAFVDTDQMSLWRSHAVKKGIPIALLDALSVGVGGALVDVAKTPVKKAVAGAVEAFAVQPALGGAGEVLGTLAAGDEIDPVNVLAEIFGEFATGPVEVAAGVYRQARVASEVKSFKNGMESIGDQQFLESVVEYAQSSAVNGRAPEVYAEFIDSLDEGREVLIPEEVAAQLEGAPEYITEQLNGLGHSVSIPLKVFASEIAKNEIWMETVRPHVKLSENTMTMEELSTNENAEMKSLLEKANVQQETMTEVEEIYEQVKDQLVSTGKQSESTARQSAQLYPATVAVYIEKARKMGKEISPTEVFAMMGFQVKSDLPAPGPTEGELIVDQAGEKVIPADTEIEMDTTDVRTGEVTTETYNAAEISTEINDNISTYERLRDCLA